MDSIVGRKLHVARCDRGWRGRQVREPAARRRRRGASQPGAGRHSGAGF